MRLTLDEIALKTGTDKSSRHHNYTEQYAFYLEKHRDTELTILELGWGGHEDPDKGGESALMWREYFPKATVVVIDNEAKNIDTTKYSGIHFRQGSQVDEEFLKELVKEFGFFHIIVDDASHQSALSIRSWEILYKYLIKGGYYFLEDTHSSYHDWYYGKEGSNPDPSKNGTEGDTALNYFKRLTDEVNFDSNSKEDEFNLFPRKYWLGYELKFVHFYKDIVVVGKK